MSEELIEALAKRLYEVGDADVGSQSWDIHPTEVCTSMARECLRQMHWAWESACCCDFDPRYNDQDDDGTVHASVHYHRVCVHCQESWAGLHCPHDGYQNPCPNCGKRPDTIRDAVTLAPPDWKPS